jgi:2'-5' RNA ligase
MSTPTPIAERSLRFVITTVLSGRAGEMVEAARREATRLTGSRAALAWPPHVTLRTGAEVPEPHAGEFVEAMGQALGAWRPFRLATTGIVHERYGAEDGTMRNLVAWSVVLDSPLHDLHRRLLSCGLWQRRPQPTFAPHLTLAFDDLDDAGAARLMAAVEWRAHLFPNRLAWICDNVCLHLREGERWIEHCSWRPELTRS